MLNGQVSGNLTWTDRDIKIVKNQLLERYPFSGRCDSAGELLHTPYADSNFHGHRPAVCTTRNTLSVYRKVGADKVKPGLSWERQVESLIASSAYQKWPTTNLWCIIVLNFFIDTFVFMCKILKYLRKVI